MANHNSSVHWRTMYGRKNTVDEKIEVAQNPAKTQEERIRAIGEVMYLCGILGPIRRAPVNDEDIDELLRLVDAAVSLIQVAETDTKDDVQAKRCRRFIESAQRTIERLT